MEERNFLREGDPAGIVKEMRLDPPILTFFGPRWRYMCIVKVASLQGMHATETSCFSLWSKYFTSIIFVCL